MQFGPPLPFYGMFHGCYCGDRIRIEKEKVMQLRMMNALLIEIKDRLYEDAK